MSSSNKSESPKQDDANGPDDKPRLTESEKKQNHIASEQKRRQAIREGFDRLADIVPGMEGQGRSEGLVLTETVKYMRAQLAERRELVQRLEHGGAVVDEAMKEPIKQSPNGHLPRQRG